MCNQFGSWADRGHSQGRSIFPHPSLSQSIFPGLHWRNHQSTTGLLLPFPQIILLPGCCFVCYDAAKRCFLDLFVFLKPWFIKTCIMWGVFYPVFPKHDRSMATFSSVLFKSWEWLCQLRDCWSLLCNIRKESVAYLYCPLKYTIWCLNFKLLSPEITHIM